MRFLLGFCLTVALALFSQGVHAGICHNDDDCEATQCCLGLVFFGECRKLEPLHDRCSVQTHGGNLHHGYCPCLGNNECVRVEEESGIVGGVMVNHTRCTAPNAE